ncbi:efflux RND transporter periplasmic adaptor subunit [Sediminicola luteus]|nr:efflux RND transporter periplasmic adaptor subunit [Sediminicola luteus]
MRNLKYLLLLGLGLAIGFLIGSLGSKTSSSDLDSADMLNVPQVWTCSMHPDVRQNEMGTCPLCAMDLVLEHNKNGGGHNFLELEPHHPLFTQIETSLVSNDSLFKAKINLTGRLTTNPETDATQTILFDGRLDKLLMNSIGDFVKKGETIGEVYAPEMYLAQDKLLTSASYQNTHPKLFAAARNSLGLWRLTDEQIEMVLKNKKPIMDFPLIADVSGTVTEVLAKEGEFYTQGAPLYKVSDLSLLWVELDAFENQLGLIEKGRMLELEFAGNPNLSQKIKVDYVEPILDSNTWTTRVRGVLVNKNRRYRPGMLVRAKIAVNDTDPSFLSIPKSALLWTGNESYVFKKTIGSKGMIFQPVKVGLGRASEERVEVLKGLQAGEEIVTEGVYHVDATAQLYAKRSFMDVLPEAGLLERVHENGASLEKETLKPLLDNYLLLKDALVASNFELAEGILKDISESLKELEDNALIVGNIVNVKTVLMTMKRQNDLEGYRLGFKKLSTEMVSLLKRQTEFNSTLYIQFCPMADGNKGGFWLSREEQIKNPYFGNEMLHCGSVEEVLK